MSARSGPERGRACSRRRRPAPRSCLEQRVEDVFENRRFAAGNIDVGRFRVTGGDESLHHQLKQLLSSVLLLLTE